METKDLKIYLDGKQPEGIVSLRLDIDGNSSYLHGILRLRKTTKGMINCNKPFDVLVRLESWKGHVVRLASFDSDLDDTFAEEIQANEQEMVDYAESKDTSLSYID